MARRGVRSEASAAGQSRVRASCGQPHGPHAASAGVCRRCSPAAAPLALPRREQRAGRAGGAAAAPAVVPTGNGNSAGEMLHLGSLQLPGLSGGGGNGLGFMM